ncbi:glycerol-3-phosphate responsive antiterminator [Gelria sp. Kuro-4]|uniref:glycerol-3-phosphate responsive antiterminator n=1 Tax=Gelria sp. Kuro-4 TaxID=2796927 RepID=UPI001BEF296F|nr:glycerol-3-phosphate responsive antiterminator [Gelria sp. Kuro-4]BCV25879.1 glycerol uptake operon antiterminator regulatory protein [Gelria sp. Kuro-4]
MAQLWRWLATSPVIAVVRSSDAVSEALAAPARCVLLATGDIASVGSDTHLFHTRGKIVFLHTDLIAGLGGDQAAVRFIARRLKPDGILTTHSQLIQAAHKEGLITIQSLFLLDSLAVKNGLTAVLKSRPAAVHVLPGILPRVIREIKATCRLPLIAGGLIRSRRDVEEALAAGAVACATGKTRLWWLGEELPAGTGAVREVVGEEH